MTRKMTIEQWLTWAFTEELCRESGGAGIGGPVTANAWSAMSEVATLGAIIDSTPNYWGVIPSSIADRDPHPVAIEIGVAVKTLTNTGFDIPAEWHPFREWDDQHGLIAAEVERVLAFERARGERQTGRHAYNLIVTCAVLKRGPDWHAERPKERMIEKQGKPAWFIQKRSKDSLGRWRTYEADGYDKRGHRPMPGAYRRWELSETLRGAILSRLDWLVWQSALKLLETSLDHTIGLGNIVPMRFDPAPWMRCKVGDGGLQETDKTG